MIAAILLADRDLLHEGRPLALMTSDEGVTLIEWQIGELKAAGVEVTEVVLGSWAEEIIGLVAGDDVEPIVNDRWREDSASSIRVGATATPRNTTTALLLQIHLPREAAVIDAVLREHEAANASVSRPVIGDEAEWPVAVDATVLARLRNIAEGAEIEDVLRDYDTLVVRTAGPLPNLESAR